jgi:2EXR family
MQWNEAFPQQRFVLIEDNLTYMQRHSTMWHLPEARRNPQEVRFHSKTPIPALLHTCTESRRIAEKSGYTLAFGKNEEENGGFWFNPDRDLLYLPTQLVHHTNGPKLEAFVGPQQKFKRLAVRAGLSGTLSIAKVSKISCFSDLEEFIVIVEHCGRGFGVPQYFEEKQNAHDLWTYVDMDKAEVMGNCLGHGQSFQELRDEIEAGKVSSFRDEVKSLEDTFQRFLTDPGWVTPSAFRITPRLIFGMIIPESKVKPLMKLRGVLEQSQRVEGCRGIIRWQWLDVSFFIRVVQLGYLWQRTMDKY